MDGATGEPLAIMQGHGGTVWGLALTHDARLLATCGADGTARLWDTGTGQQLAALRGHIGEVWSVALAADGRLVAIGGADGTVRLWDAHQLALIRTLRAEGRYKHMDITGLTGITDTQRAALLALGAVESIPIGHL